MAKREKFNLFNENWFVLADILLANGVELSLNLPKFARPLDFSFLIGVFGTSTDIFRGN